MRLPQLCVAGVASALLLLPPTSFGQEKPKQPAPRQYIVCVGVTRYLQTASRKPLQAVKDSDGKDLITYKLDEKEATYLVDVASAKINATTTLIPTNDPSKIMVDGLSPGASRIALVDKDGAKETCDIVVRRMVFVPIGASQPVRLTSKQPVKKIGNEAEKTIRVEAVGNDRSQVKVTGLMAGDTRFSLIGNDGKTETFEVVVRSDKVPGKNTIFVPGDAFEIFQLPSKKPFATVINDTPGVLRVFPVTTDPTKLLLVPQSLGIARLTVTEAAVEKHDDRKTETYEVIVRASGNPSKQIIVLTVGEMRRLQLSTKKPVGEIGTRHVLENLGIQAKIDPNDDSTVIVSAQREGGCKLTLADKDDKQETFYIAVRKKSPKEKK